MSKSGLWAKFGLQCYYVWSMRQYKTTGHQYHAAHAALIVQILESSAAILGINQGRMFTEIYFGDLIDLLLFC